MSDINEKERREILLDAQWLIDEANFITRINDKDNIIREIDKMFTRLSYIQRTLIKDKEHTNYICPFCNHVGEPRSHNEHSSLY